VVVFPYPILDGYIKRGGAEGSQYFLHFDTLVGKDGRAHCEVPTAVIGGMGMRAAFHEKQLMLPTSKKKLDLVGDFMASFVQKLQQIKASMQSAHLGWHVEDGNVAGFVYNGIKYTPTGQQPAGELDTVMAQIYRPTGRVEPWLAAAKLVTDQKRPDLSILLATAFAAPLIKFVNQKGCTVNFFSTESGAGKTTSLETALAVWGDPLLGKSTVASTTKSTTKKMGELRSLPVYYDEPEKGKDFMARLADLTYSVTEGREGDRLSRSADLRMPGSWQTLLVTCSNASIVDYIINHAKSTNAGLHRIFSVEVGHPGRDYLGRIKQADASRITGRCLDNYGNIGTQYAKFLGENHKDIEDEVYRVHSDLCTEVNVLDEERFWVAFMASILVGAKYANELGYTEFELGPIHERLLACYAAMNKLRAAESCDLRNPIHVKSIVNQFTTEKKMDHTIITDTMWLSAQGRPSPGSVVVKCDASRVKSVQVQRSLDGAMRINSGVFKDWLRRNGHNPRAVVQAMERELGAVQLRGRLGAGTGHQVLQCGVEPLIELKVDAVED
jgi:hypothetical protein